MKTRRLGKTDLEVSELGFGCIRFGGVGQEKITRMIGRAMDAGITLFDTARAYGDSEAKLGKALGRRRKDVVIVSKTIRRSYAEGASDVDESLKNLRTDHIDVYLCHDCTDRAQYEKAVGPRGSLSALKKAQKAGKIRFVGISAHSLEILTDAMNTGEFQVVELAYNANNPAADRRLLPLASRLDIGKIVMKPFGGGRLVVPAGRRKLGEDDLTGLDALRFVLANRHVTTVIPGIQRLNELEQCLRVRRAERPSREWLKEARRKAMLFGKEFCRGCGYCLPCPQRIPIPKILRIYSELVHLKQNWAAMGRARAAYPRIKRNITVCADCAECEQRCPYDLNIREQLAAAHERLGG